MKKLFGAVCFIAVLSVAKPASSQSFRYFVSPSGQDNNSGLDPDNAFATLEKARDAVRTMKQKNSSDTAFVCLTEGEYPLKQTFALNAEDGGTEKAPVIYTALPGHKVVLKGGKKITKWKKYKGNIWSAAIPEVKKQEWKFTQLFVNGKERKRARLPKTGFYRVTGFPDGGAEVSYQTPSSRFEYKPGDINPKFKNLQDIEAIVYHFWTDVHLPVKSVDDKKHIITFQYPSGKVFTDDFNKNGARYVLDNVWEGLKDPGDWYLDKKEGRLYYIPMQGEDMSKADVWAPAIQSLIQITGDALNRNWASYIRFSNIDFQLADGQLPKGNVNNAQGSSSVPAAITLSGARNCTFDNCSVSNIGGFAFDIIEGSAYNQFSNNNLFNLSGGGFRVNGGKPSDHPLLQTHNNIISDNDIGPYGLYYPSAVGVLLMHTHTNQVIHNNIHHGFYTGVSVGWEWGYQRSISRDNIIAYNHIHHIGQGLLSDMGGIYTLGVSPGTILRNNLIHDVDANNYGGWGIYNDEGSTHILVENNIVYNTKFAGYNINFAKEITVRNNIFALGRLQQISRNHSEPHTSVFFENNIVYWKEGALLDENWRDTPYSFYFLPGKEGTRQDTSTFRMDYNIYYNPQRSLDSINFNSNTWKEWQAKGKDVHSAFTDPLFKDPSHYDFTLLPNSPALKMGFQPIDIKKAGPRRKK